MKLYEITESMKALEAWADDPEAQAGIMETLEGAESEKLESICKLIRSKSALAKAKKDEAKSLTESARSDENLVDRLKEMMRQHLEATGKDKASAGLFTVGIQNAGGKAPLLISENADFETVNALFPGLVKTEYKWDSDRIREALEEGKFLYFAEIGPRSKVVMIR